MCMTLHDSVLIGERHRMPERPSICAFWIITMYYDNPLCTRGWPQLRGPGGTSLCTIPPASASLRVLDVSFVPAATRGVLEGLRKRLPECNVICSGQHKKAEDYVPPGMRAILQKEAFFPRTQARQKKQAAKKKKQG